jgi:hypothetical protein
MKLTIEEMEVKLEAAWREAWHWEGMIFQEKLKAKALTPEEVKEISENIGSKLIGSGVKRRNRWTGKQQ